nr:hypothetical protein Iba_chr14aCG6360 [Ipomoea batatas]
MVEGTGRINCVFGHVSEEFPCHQVIVRAHICHSLHQILRMKKLNKIAIDVEDLNSAGIGHVIEPNFISGDTLEARIEPDDKKEFSGREEMECAMALAVDWAEAMAASAGGCKEAYWEESVKVAPGGGGKVRLVVAMANCSGGGRGDMRLAVMVVDRTVVAAMVLVVIVSSESSDNIHGFSKQFLAIYKINFDSLPVSSSISSWFNAKPRAIFHVAE